MGPGPRAHAAAGNVFINIVVSNGADEKKETQIKYYLPKEISPEDVINTAGLKLDYDLDTSMYFVSGTTELGPKESKIIKLEVKDVWRVTDEEVDLLRTQIDRNLELLEKTELYDSAKILRDNMVGKLEYVLAQQKNYSDNIERRIEEYRAYADQVNEIRTNAFSAQYLKSTPIDEAAEKGRTVKFVIEVKNSADEPKTFKQQHYLPAEVRAEHVVDSQGFEVRFDESRQQAYLSKEEEFKPGETKRYEIAIRDIWNIPETRVDSLKKRAEVAVEGIKGSEYEEGANYIAEALLRDLEAIKSSQKEREDVKKYIGAFRLNKERYKKSDELVRQLEALLATVKAKKLEEFEKSKVTNILQKLKALRGIMAISQAIFGKKPSITTTWYIIWAVLAFVALFTSLHFFTWWRKAQVMGEEFAIKAGGTIKEVAPAEESPEEKK